MTLEEFKQRVRSTFGPEMEHATPANVRAFLTTLARERWQEQRSRPGSPGPVGRIEIPVENAASYEEILRGFFAHVLDVPRDEALIDLWTMALELAYADIEEQYEQQLGGLFEEGLDGPGADDPD